MQMNVCIIGSLRHYDKMLKIAKIFIANGMKVSLPIPGKYRDAKNPGKYVSNYRFVPPEEKIKEEGIRVFSHFEKIRRSDIVYIVNPGGYVGFNTAVEICCAYENKKPIYALDVIRDARSLFLMNFVQKVLSPEELVSLVLAETRAFPIENLRSTPALELTPCDSF
jgi:hypothetical protein